MYKILQNKYNLQIKNIKYIVIMYIFNIFNIFYNSI
jgi:hypothetical protein